MDLEQRLTLLNGQLHDLDNNVEHINAEALAGGPYGHEDPRAGRVDPQALKRRKWWRDAAVNAMFIASWFGFATLLSMYNKWMFSPTYLNFPFPLFVTTTHMLVQFLLAWTIRSLWPRLFNPPGRPSIKQYAQKCVPCAVTTGLDIGLSNLSLKTITLSLYTMCKSSSLIFVLLFAFVFRLERFSIRLVSVIMLITSGVLLMVLSTDVEGHGGPPPPGGDVEMGTQSVSARKALSSLARAVGESTLGTPLVLGVILVFAASAFGGLRWALTQLLLTESHDMRSSSPLRDGSSPRTPGTMGLANPAATIFFLSPAMFTTLLVVSSIVEGPLPTKLAASGFFDTFSGGFGTISLILLPGAIAFAMVMSEYYIIQRTGIVPMSIAGIFKEVTTILLATLFFHDDMTLLNWVGLMITVCGIATFTYHKYQRSISSLDEDSPEFSKGISLPDYEPIGADEEEREITGALSPEEFTWMDGPRPRNDSVKGGNLEGSPHQTDESLNTLFDASGRAEFHGSQSARTLADRRKKSTDDDFVGNTQSLSGGILSSPGASKLAKDKSRRVRFSTGADRESSHNKVPNIYSPTNQ